MHAPMALQPRKRFCIKEIIENQGFYMKQQCLVLSPENQNHACSTTNSKDKSENDIHADQTKCIGTFGDVF